MSQSIIQVANLTRTFTIKRRNKNLPFYKRIFSSERILVEAVRGISLEIPNGERTAIIGPNGAGKSTTIRMLTGLLLPTAGSVKVLNLEPCRARHILSKKIGCVFGQLSHLWAHLTIRENFSLFGRMYGIPNDLLEERLTRLVQLFELESLYSQRPIQLSLGERMRCEIVASLLHEPEILFLDEPSVGLDILARIKLREVVREYAKSTGATVLLTSHDTGDIEGVCERVIVINDGLIVFDGSLTSLRQKYDRKRVIRVQTESQELSLTDERLTTTKESTHLFTVSFDSEKMKVEEAISKVLSSCNVLDIAIEGTKLEEVIAELYREAL